MKNLIFLMTVLLFLQESAMANAAASSAAEVDCTINMSVLNGKDSKSRSNPSLDLRIVTFPLLKLSGRSAVLKPQGMTIGCQNNYGGQIDENTLVSACPEFKEGEAPQIDRLEIVLIHPPEGMRRDYFCNPQRSSGAQSKSTNGTK